MITRARVFELMTTETGSTAKYPILVMTKDATIRQDARTCDL